eukprot:GDKK01050641.1.p2 GENE.GDKK01050641.1~~GDKK01050641.1.p2  ORF type:complete len:125 (+),score=9.09 GDKK01050641.1:1-375(+)
MPKCSETTSTWSTRSSTRPTRAPEQAQQQPPVGLIQGRITMNAGTSAQLFQAVQTFGNEYIFFTTLDNDSTTSTEIALPNYASDLNGQFVQYVSAPLGSTFIRVSTLLRYIAGTPFILQSPNLL